MIGGEEFDRARMTKKQSSEVAVVISSSHSSKFGVLERFVEMDNGADALEQFLIGFLPCGVDGRNGSQDSFVGVCFLQSG